MAQSTEAHSRQGNSKVARVATETTSALKTTELVAYVVAVVGVLVASMLTDVSDFGPQEAWFYVTLLTIGYLVSRGLAKAGSYEREEAASHR